MFMKKGIWIIIGIIVVVIFIGKQYNNNIDAEYEKEKNESNYELNKSSNNVNKLNKSVSINNIGFECYYIDNNYARIVCDSMILNKEILDKVVDSLKISVSPIYFHINTLKETGEEFAISMNGESSIYQYPPKNKQDIAINSLVMKLSSEISNIKLLENNKDLQFEDIDNAISTIENAASIYRNSSNDDSNVRIKKLRISLKSKLSAAQIKVFPRLRKVFCLSLKDKMWVEDISVKYTNKTITLTGRVYAANKNIQSSYEAINNRLSQLRFTKISFKWYEYDNGSYYTIESKSDGSI